MVRTKQDIEAIQKRWRAENGYAWMDDRSIPPSFPPSRAYPQIQYTPPPTPPIYPTQTPSAIQQAQLHYANQYQQRQRQHPSNSVFTVPGTDRSIALVPQQQPTVRPQQREAVFRSSSGNTVTIPQQTGPHIPVPDPSPRVAYYPFNAQFQQHYQYHQPTPRVYGRVGPTGLPNSGHYCYMNAMIQVLRATPLFADDINRWIKTIGSQYPLLQYLGAEIHSFLREFTLLLDGNMNVDSFFNSVLILGRTNPHGKRFGELQPDRQDDVQQPLFTVSQDLEIIEELVRVYVTAAHVDPHVAQTLLHQNGVHSITDFTVETVQEFESIEEGLVIKQVKGRDLVVTLRLTEEMIPRFHPNIPFTVQQLYMADTKFKPHVPIEDPRRGQQERKTQVVERTIHHVTDYIVFGIERGGDDEVNERGQTVWRTRDLAVSYQPVEIIDGIKYMLYAVVFYHSHGGRVNFGHYSTCVLRDRQWYNCNDETVTEVPGNQPILNMRTASMLFYKRMGLLDDPDSI